MGGNRRQPGDRDDEGAFPSWGNDLSVRVTHDPSGHFADLTLGQGDFFFGENTFDGRKYSNLYGTRVNPGDGFTFEFFEFSDELANAPDAIWTELAMEIEAIADPSPLPSLNPGFIRVAASGRDSHPSNVTITGGPDGDINYSDFWNIEYAAGSTGPSITQIDIRLSDDGSVYFSPDDVAGAITGGDLLTGIDLLNVGVIFDEQGVQLADSFSRVSLTFPPDEFTAGDVMSFGVDIDAIGLTQDAFEQPFIVNGHWFFDSEFSGELPSTRERTQRRD